MSTTMEKMMDASLGEVGSELRATYKKTVNVRQYETEVIELETTLRVDKQLSGGERMLISAILQAQLEYTAYCQLAFKGLVTTEELSRRKKSLEDGVTAIKSKAESVLGYSLDKIMEQSITKE